MLTMILSLLVTLQIDVKNPDPTPRKDVAIVVPVPQTGEYRSASVRGAEATPWQLDDMNSDGRADELVLLLDLDSKESRRLLVDLSDAAPVAKVTPRTSAFMKLNDKNQKHPRINAICFPGDADNKVMYNSLYGHGAMLENEHNAYRVYLDNRQSVDLYSKNTPRLELDETNFYTTRKQLDEGYGRDVLWAGTSVALGSFRGYQGEQPVTIDSVRSRSQRVVTSGPLRSVIEVNDRGWKINGKTVDMTQRYTTYAGQSGVEVEISLSPEGRDAVYCTGVQKLMDNNSGAVTPDGVAYSFGSNVPDKAMAEVVDTLGLAVFVPEPYLAGVKEDALNYLTLLRPDKDGKIRYYFTASSLRTKGESSPNTPSPMFLKGIESDCFDEALCSYLGQMWGEVVPKWAENLASPVKVKVKEKK